MQRRDVSITLAGTLAGLPWRGAAAQARSFEEGQHYVRLARPAPVTLPDPAHKVEVVEFFSYACPHCWNLEPLLDGWTRRLAADVWFHQLPVAFNAPMVLLQKLHFALAETGRLPALHRKVFAAIHQQGRKLASDAEIVAFVSANGVDGAAFSSVYKSAAVQAQAARAKALSEAYKIDGIPALGVQGRFYTAASMTGSHERALQATDFLIQRARQGV